MKKIFLYITFLFSSFVQGQSLDVLLWATSAYKQGQYEEVLELLKGVQFQGNLDAYFLVIQSEYALIDRDYNENIAKFDYNRLESLREQVKDYLSRAKNPKGIQKVTQIQERLKEYPSLEVEFLLIRNQKSEKDQLDNLRYALEHRQYDQVLSLVEEYQQNQVLAPFHLDYYRALARARKVNKNTSSEEREEIKQALKAYKEAYHKKNVLYDQAIDASLKKIR
nr:hypothetical protein [uncultured Capnocytophaga sp.]